MFEKFFGGKKPGVQVLRENGKVDVVSGDKKKKMQEENNQSFEQKCKQMANEINEGKRKWYLMSTNGSLGKIGGKTISVHIEKIGEPDEEAHTKVLGVNEAIIVPVDENNPFEFGHGDKKEISQEQIQEYLDKNLVANKEVVLGVLKAMNN